MQNLLLIFLFIFVIHGYLKRSLEQKKENAELRAKVLSDPETMKKNSAANAKTKTKTNEPEEDDASLRDELMSFVQQIGADTNTGPKASEDCAPKSVPAEFKGQRTDLSDFFKDKARTAISTLPSAINESSYPEQGLPKPFVSDTFSAGSGDFLPGVSVSSGECCDGYANIDEVTSGQLLPK